MGLRCLGRKMAGGSEHEHIAALTWIDTESKNPGTFTREQMVAYIEKNGTNAVWCPDQQGGPSAWVHVNSNGRVEYPQTRADGRWSNNLLALPIVQ